MTVQSNTCAADEQLFRYRLKTLMLIVTILLLLLVIGGFCTGYFAFAESGHQFHGICGVPYNSDSSEYMPLKAFWDSEGKKDFE